MRLQALLAGLVAVLTISACAPPAPTINVPTAPTATIGLSSSLAAPSQSAQTSVPIAELPLVEADPAVLTAVCDPEASQGHPDAGDTKVFCFDAIVLGLRAMRWANRDPVERIYLARRSCANVVCSDDELSDATIAAWSGATEFIVELDARSSSLSAPVELSSPAWPVAVHPDSSPALTSPIVGAPPEVLDRTPLPFCGDDSAGHLAAALGCFRDSVLSGQAAEMVQHPSGTDGSLLLWLFRFDGRGAIRRYQSAQGTWLKQSGSLVLGTDASSWDFDPWDAGTAVP